RIVGLAISQVIVRVELRGLALLGVPGSVLQRGEVVVQPEMTGEQVGVAKRQGVLACVQPFVDRLIGAERLGGRHELRECICEPGRRAVAVDVVATPRWAPRRRHLEWPWAYPNDPSEAHRYDGADPRM